jgi:hypothetical protein
MFRFVDLEATPDRGRGDFGLPAVTTTGARFPAGVTMRAPRGLRLRPRLPRGFLIARAPPRLEPADISTPCFRPHHRPENARLTPRENWITGREKQRVVQLVPARGMVYFSGHVEGETRRHGRDRGKLRWRPGRNGGRLPEKVHPMYAGNRRHRSGRRPSGDPSGSSSDYDRQTARSAPPWQRGEAVHGAFGPHRSPPPSGGGEGETARRRLRPAAPVRVGSPARRRSD